MRQSDSTKQLLEALNAAQKEFTPVPKLKTATIKLDAGGSYSYKYADLGDVLAMCSPILSKHGLVLQQPLTRIEGKQYVVTRISHVSGEMQESDGIEMHPTNRPQIFGTEQTYWRRYDLVGMVGISVDEDIDTAPGVDAEKNSPQARRTRETGKMQSSKEPNRGHGNEGFDQSSGHDPAGETQDERVANSVLMDVVHCTLAVSAARNGSKFAKVTCIETEKTKIEHVLYCWHGSLHEYLAKKPTRCVFKLKQNSKGVTIEEIVSVGGRPFVKPEESSPESGKAAAAGKEAF